MKVLRVERAEPAEVFDASACGTHTLMLANGAIISNCFGKTCGVCDADDLKLRRGYIQAAADEIHVDLSRTKVIDQKSVAMKVRCRLWKGVEKRQVMNDHFRYAIRRAANLAEMPLTKRTVKFASDNFKFKDWTCGTDFVEFSLTKKLSKFLVAEYIEEMNKHLKGDNEEASVQITDFTVLPATADAMRQDVDVSLFEMEVDVDPVSAERRIEWWNEQEYIKMVFREETRMGGQTIQEVNARELVDDLWVARDGHRLMLRMLLRGKATPYLVYAVLFDRKSWIEAAKYPAMAIDKFIEIDDTRIDFFRPQCVECERPIPINLLDKPFDGLYCPRCRDAVREMVPS